MPRLKGRRGGGIILTISLPGYCPEPDYKNRKRYI